MTQDNCDPQPVPAAPHLPAERRFLRSTIFVLIALICSAAISGVSYSLFTRNNDFPITYHPDEWSKVDQIASQRQPRNLNHPLLMLEAANVLRGWSDVSLRDDLAVAIVGRNTSALLASIGVFCFGMAGFVLFRLVGLAIVGTTLALCPPLLVYAHYFKEDASLIGGIGVAVLGATLVLTARQCWTQALSAIVLGIGCAAAASGKYVGAAVIAPALLAVFIAHIPRWWAVPIRIVVFLVVAAVTFVAINARAFDDPWTLTLKPYAQYSFEEEFEHGTTSHDGVRLTTPGLFCIRIAASEVMPHLWIGFALSIAAIVFAAIARSRSKRLPVESFSSSESTTPFRVSIRTMAVLLGFLATFALVLSFNAIPFARYALPITVLSYFLIACVICVAIGALQFSMRARVLVVCLSLAVIVFMQGRRCLQYDRQFADDSRQRLRDWVALNLPRGSTIIADSFAQLSARGDRHRFPNQPRLNVYVRGFGHAASAGPLHRLAASGIRYVVVAEPNYQRFFAPGVEAVEGTEQRLEAMRAFYMDLFARGTLLWSSKPSPANNAYVDPELAIYDITVFKDDPPGTSLEPEDGRFRNWFRRQNR